MDTALLALHIIVCLFLVILVLLQSGREGMGVIFGGGNTSASNASSSSSMLTKLTASLAVIFICTSLGYNIITSADDDASSILDVQFEENLPSTQSAPAPTQVAPAKPETKSE